MQVSALLLLIAGIHLQLNEAAVTKKSGEDEFDVPEECKHLTYCTIKPANYPTEKYNDMLKNFKILQQPKYIQDISFETRIKDSGEEDNCEADVSSETLYAVKVPKAATWRIVVNAPLINYQQRVRLETCKNANAPCFTQFPARAEFKTMCVQKYVSWQIMVEGEGNKTEIVKPRLPSCCSCYYKPLDFSSRMGSKEDDV